MTREDKNLAIDALTVKLNDANIFYIADIAGLDAESSSDLRRSCFKNDVQIELVKKHCIKICFRKS